MGAGRQRNITIASLLLWTALLCAPFLIKPPHIDEESYLFIGSAIADHPLRPYDWWRAWQPFTSPAEHSYLYAHPPLFLWWISACIQLVGSADIPLLRLLQLPWALLLSLSLWGVARRVCAQPWLATVGMLAAPGVLLVFHQSLMIDLMTLALGMAAMAMAWPGLVGADAHRARPFLGGLLLGMACITKYPALLFMGGMVAVAWAHRGAWLRRSAPPVALGLLILVGWQLGSWGLYGAPHLYVVLTTAAEIARTPLISRMFGTLSHLGFTVTAPPLLLLAVAAVRRPTAALGGAFAMAVGAMGLLLLGQHWDVSGRSEGLRATLALAAEGLPPDSVGRGMLLLAFVLGAGALAVLARGLADGRSRPVDRGMAAWAALGLIGVTVTHNFVGARYLSLAAVPLGLTLWRSLERSVPARRLKGTLISGVAVSLMLSMAVAVADLRWAEVYPELVAEISAGGGLTSCEEIRFAGEWGFRHQAGLKGWRRLDAAGLAPGACAVIAEGAAPEPPLNTQGLTRLRQVSGPRPSPWLRTHAPAAGIGFYSDGFGLLPYGLGDGPLETVTVWRRPSPEGDATP